METWRVRMFAHLRERHGEVVEVTADDSVRAVLEALRQKDVEVEGCRMAVNLEFALANDELKAGDELALIPPVSGG